MATITAITTLALATGSTYGYSLTTFSQVRQNEGNATRYVAILQKQLNPKVHAATGFFGGAGEAATLASAKTFALNALNAARMQRYAGSPGAAAASTVVADLHGDVPTVDSN